MSEDLPHPRNVLEFGYPVLRENTSVSSIIIHDHISISDPTIYTGKLYKKPGDLGLYWKAYGGIEINLTLGGGGDISNPLSSDLYGNSFDLLDIGDIETSVHPSINDAISDRVMRSGDTMTGDLSLGGNDLTSILTSEYNHTTTPTNPAVGKIKIYTKNDDNLYILNSSGTETLIGATSSTTLQDAYDNSGASPVILTDGDGALVIRQGASGPDEVLQINSQANVTTFAVQGDGVLINNNKTIVGVYNGLGTFGNFLVGGIYGGITTAASNTTMGDESLNSISTGSSNTTMGVSAGDTITTGSYNTIIGGAANTTTNNANYRIAVGYGASSDTDRHMTVGSSGALQSLLALKPGTDNECDLGTPTNRFKNIYAESIISGITAYTTNATIDASTNKIITMDSASTVTLTLPSTPIDGTHYTIININHGDVVITRGGSDTIDDGISLTLSLSNIHDRTTLLYVGTVWYMV